MEKVILDTLEYDFMRKLDYKNEIVKISSFLETYLTASGFKKLIIGISGGIDSALSAALAVKAIGKENVIGVLMPYKLSNPESLQDGKILCSHLDITYKVVDISKMVDAYFEANDPEADKLRFGNWMARTRMCVLFDLSAKYDALVVGTTNQSELMTGYFTQYGDSACAIEPIGKLYKSEVWEMARTLGIPNKLIEKTPTADLWENQSDENEMGISYAELDQILYSISKNKSLEQFPDSQVNLVYRLIARSSFKRLPPPFPEDPCCL